MIRRYGESPARGQNYTRRAGVYAILPVDGGLLATLQTEPLPELQLPGGGIDRGEHPVAALHREVFEETGWSIAVECRLGAFRRFTYMPEYNLWAEKICTIYLARPILRRGPPTEPAHRAVWLPMAEAARQLGNPGDRAFFADFLRRTGF
ncbi:NUDIX hydrolase [Szabonella alba]|uniref:NUDIX hydrolase n=1 Tax=Szabonella alba TaxID=2804194 RepID=A0A8K0VD05_9RHOB|nr:NUDIX hydrolase [Szabonella alba]MBL4916885.1 NUDIX hydrolase [Szabonella alba]